MGHLRADIEAGKVLDEVIAGAVPDVDAKGKTTEIFRSLGGGLVSG
jgi:hypothetical protein